MSEIAVACCQFAPTVGDPDGSTERARRAADLRAGLARRATIGSDGAISIAITAFGHHSIRVGWRPARQHCSVRAVSNGGGASLDVWL